MNDEQREWADFKDDSKALSRYFCKLGTALSAVGTATGGALTYAVSGSLEASFTAAAVFGTLPALAIAGSCAVGYWINKPAPRPHP